jgi:hypothetical protein
MIFFSDKEMDETFGGFPNTSIINELPLSALAMDRVDKITLNEIILTLVLVCTCSTRRENSNGRIQFGRRRLSFLFSTS